jgi:hypothetical protein
MPACSSPAAARAAAMCSATFGFCAYALAAANNKTAAVGTIRMMFFSYYRDISQD